jgi:hypothetical protein
MAAWVELRSAEVNFNGTSEVTLVPAPSAGLKHVVLSIKVRNHDSIAHSILIRKKVAGVYTDQAFAATVQPGGFSPEVNLTVIDASDETIVGVLGEAVAGTQPRADVSYMERSTP